MRKPLIVGNWKMNGTKSLASELVGIIKNECFKTDVEVAICCPYTLLGLVSELCKDSALNLGAQNVHWEDPGAFTGEISAEMLAEYNVVFVIVGHSERRAYFNENDEIINRKVIKAIKSGLNPILCVGETLREKEAGNTLHRVEEQIVNAIKGIDSKELKNITIAYEPIWAIGTGKTPTPKDANDVIAFIRNIVCKLFGEVISEEIRILYGGSVTSSNASEFLNEVDIDGALVGGASLNAQDFIGIINF